MDCYRAYAPFCVNPQVVHDIHIKPGDAIAPRRLEHKAGEIRSGCPLRIGYVGRADASKGGIDWIEAIKALVAAGHDVGATWLGDGPILAEMRSAARRLGISDRVGLPGFVADRQAVFEFLKNLHVLMFCHKVPESPRALLESLVCGTPIVGYVSSYPRGLLSGRNWGVLTTPDDVTGLASAVGYLDEHREELAEMVFATSTAGSIYNDEAVFRHRSDLIKEYL